MVRGTRIRTPGPPPAPAVQPPVSGDDAALYRAANLLAPQEPPRRRVDRVHVRRDRASDEHRAAVEQRNGRFVAWGHDAGLERKHPTQLPAARIERVYFGSRRLTGI